MENKVLHFPDLSVDKIKVLLDTNILIEREDYKTTNPSFSELLSLLLENSIVIFVHPNTIDELQKDQVKFRKESILSKVKSYPVLDNPPFPDQNFLDNLNIRNSHDKIDGTLLYAVHMDVVDFLITEDKLLISRAEKIDLGERVMNVSSALSFFKGFLKKGQPLTPPYISSGKASTIVNHLSDSFFNSFKEDYPEFERWFKRKARDRDVYYILDQTETSAIMILKNEEEPIELTNAILPKQNRLKICSLKISDSQSNYRVFEKFLSLAFDKARLDRVGSVYVTVYPKHSNLIVMLKKFGFEEKGEIKNTREIVLEKGMTGAKKVDAFDYVKYYYPNFIDDESVSKFIIPVRDIFHSELFPEVPVKQMTMAHFDSHIPVSNAIVKVYLSKSKISTLKRGDVLLFYRSKKETGITSIGVLEEIGRFYTIREILDFAGNRIVYSKDDLNLMLDKNGILCLKFWLTKYLENKIDSHMMKEFGISIPQSICRIDNKKYKELLGRSD